MTKKNFWIKWLLVLHYVKGYNVETEYSRTQLSIWMRFFVVKISEQPLGQKQIVKMQ